MSAARRLVVTVRRALKPCGLAVVPDGDRWAVVSVDDVEVGAFGVLWIYRRRGHAYARRLEASDLARWADGWLACWRVWGAGKG